MSRLLLLLSRTGNRPDAGPCLTWRQLIRPNPLQGDGHLDFRIGHYSVPVRCLSAPAPPRQNFLSKLIDNIKQEMAKEEGMKESIKKFKDDTKQLEQSDALKKARQKYKVLESETSRSSQVLKEKLEEFKDKLQETLEEAQKTDVAKKAGQMAKSVKGAAETVSEKGQQIGKTTAFKTISEGVKAVKQEIDDNTGSRAQVYKPPVKLRKRLERVARGEEESKPIAPNMDATGVELHKDSQWYQSWQNFKDNNPYVNKVFDWKMRFDESDNPMVRASRAVTDKVSEILGGMFQKTELSEVLTEICKMDPDFDKENFLKECEHEIIPNILESLIRGELDILKDWCHEAPYKILSTPITQAKALGYKFQSKILDISNVDLAMGKMMDQGPVLIITFQTQQIMAVKDQAGQVVEGNLDKIMRINYVWVLCRDQTELDPKAAWKLMDLSANSSEQWL